MEGTTVSLLQYWVQFIRESLGHVDEDVKLAAVTAFEAVAETYLAATVEGKSLFSRELLAPLTKLLEARGTQCHKRVGAARALGSTPAKLAEHYIDEVRLFFRRLLLLICLQPQTARLGCLTVAKRFLVALAHLTFPSFFFIRCRQLLDALIHAASFPDLDAECLAEARAAALWGLCLLCKRLLAHNDQCLTEERASRTYEAFVRGLEDYTIDRRGDVGSKYGLRLRFFFFSFLLVWGVSWICGLVCSRSFSFVLTPLMSSVRSAAMDGLLQLTLVFAKRHLVDQSRYVDARLDATGFRHSIRLFQKPFSFPA